MSTIISIYKRNHCGHWRIRTFSLIYSGIRLRLNVSNQIFHLHRSKTVIMFHSEVILAHFHVLLSKSFLSMWHKEIKEHVKILNLSIKIKLIPAVEKLFCVKIYYQCFSRAVNNALFYTIKLCFALLIKIAYVEIDRRSHIKSTKC